MQKPAPNSRTDATEPFASLIVPVLKARLSNHFWLYCGSWGLTGRSAEVTGDPSRRRIVGTRCVANLDHVRARLMGPPATERADFPFVAKRPGRQADTKPPGP